MSNKFIQHIENLQCYLKRSYEQKFKISENGTTKHDSCINHCLLYAFGTCDELHTKVCNECQELFTFFINLKEIIDSTTHKDGDSSISSVLVSQSDLTSFEPVHSKKRF
ncbi:hypothetical protein RhiirB3_453095 [Rhizophagus irregularis]|nr:hypothetical protein RhiirB3_453095 [Rhizophagus irregularis]